MTVGRSGWGRRFRSALPLLIRRTVETIPSVRRWLARRELAERGLAFDQAVFVNQVRQGKAAEVRLFLSARIPPNATDEAGDTALTAAASCGRADLVRLLLDYGVLAASGNEAGSSALVAAESAGHAHVVELLLAAGVPAQDLWRARLLRAAELGDADLARRALDEGAELDCRDTAGRTPLSLTAGGAPDDRVMEVGRLLLDRLSRAVAADPSGAPELLRRVLEARDRSGRTPLLWAAEAGGEAMVRELLARGANVDAVDRAGRTALILAARGGHPEVVGLLLDHRPAPDLLGVVDQGCTALREAIERGSTAVEARLRRALPGCAAVSGEVSLLRAAARGDLARVRTLLDAGCDANVRDGEGNSPLILAAARGRTAVVELLLARGAGATVRNEAEDTALISAARAGHPEVVRRLVERAEIDVEAHNAAGDTALVAAAREARAEVVEVLLGLAAGAGVRLPAKPETRGAHGTTALVEACAANSLRVVELLLTAGASPDLKVAYGHAPWMVAALAGHHGILDRLDRASARRGRTEAELFTAIRAGDERAVRDLARRAVLDARTMTGRTALMEAAESGNVRIVEALLDAGAEISEEDRTGATAVRLAAAAGRDGALAALLARHPDAPAEATAALSWAARRGHSAAVRLLHREGADLEARSRSGDTPLILAVAEGKEQVVATLLDLGADPSAPGRYGVTPLAVAVLNNQARIASMLVEHGAQPSREGNLIAAARRGDTERMTTLLAAGARVEARDRNGRTALMAAVTGGHLPAVTALLTHLGPKAREAAEDRDLSGTTVLMRGAAGGRVPIVEALLATGARPDVPGRRRRTPLNEAAAAGRLEVVELLARHGVDLDHRDDDGRTPLSDALLNGHRPVAELLQGLGATAGLAEAMLVEAAAAGDTRLVQQLVDQGAELEGPLGRTALPAAAEAGRQEAVMALLAAGADVEAATTGGATALVHAAARGDREMAAALLEKGADPGAVTDSGRTALMEAAVVGGDAVVAALLEAGANADVADRRGGTALILAAREGHAAVVDVLLAKGGTDLELRDDMGRTALAWALLMHHEELAAKLREAGARGGAREVRLLEAVRAGEEAEVRRLLGEDTDPGARDDKGNPALVLAASRSERPIVEALLDRGADPDARGARGRTALLAASALGRLEAVTALLAAAADVEARDHRRDTSLLVAARRGFREVVEELAAHGADLEVRNARGETALISASARGRLEVVQQLLARQVSTSSRTTAGRTALLAAAEAGHAPVVEALLEARADPETTDREGRTAWDLAFGRSRDAVLAVLEAAGARPASDLGAIVYLAPSGERYHRRTCGALAPARDADQLLRRPIAAARAEGYDPCRLCHPDRGSPLGHRDLSFSVRHPKRARSGSRLPLHAYAFRASAAELVERDAEEHGPEEDFTTVAAAGGQAGPGDLLTAALELEGFQIDHPVLAVWFREPWHRFEFWVTAPPELAGATVEGTVTFALLGVFLASLPVSLEVLQAGVPQGAAAELETASERLRGKVFASYSRHDVQIVERVEVAARALGLDYLRDVVTLRSGDDFHTRLPELIEEADAFQLFWSPRAAASRWVDQEWNHALGLIEAGRKPRDFIRPVYWNRGLTFPERLTKLCHFRYEPGLAEPLPASPVAAPAPRDATDGQPLG